MRILAIETEVTGGDLHADAAVLRAEAAAVWALQKREIIREIWFTRSDKRAVLLLECASEAEARRHLDALPLVQGKHIRFDVHGLRAYDGFDRLLSEQEPLAGAAPPGS